MNTVGMRHAAVLSGWQLHLTVSCTTDFDVRYKTSPFFSPSPSTPARIFFNLSFLPLCLFLGAYSPVSFFQFIYLILQYMTLWLSTVNCDLILFANWIAEKYGCSSFSYVHCMGFPSFLQKEIVLIMKWLKIIHRWYTNLKMFISEKIIKCII